MKVGTDGVLLGAWANLPEKGKVLDIGTGTGLIALMIAQRSELLQIDAVEIDEKAVKQASQNVMCTPWYKRIKVICNDFFELNSDYKYDLIICNPPFYQNSPKSSSKNRDKARSQVCFSIQNFISKASDMLNDYGKLTFILPITYEDLIYKYLDDNKLFKCRICKVQPTPLKPVNRLLIEASIGGKEVVLESIIIEENGRHKYSEKYKQLLSDFFISFPKNIH